MRTRNAYGTILMQFPFFMPETPDEAPKPIPEGEASDAAKKPTKVEAMWNDLSEETKRQLMTWSCLQARERRIQRQRRGEPTPLADPLPPPIDDREPAPPVDGAALRRLASDEEMREEEIDGLFALIGKHRIWYDTFHRLLREETHGKGQQQGEIS